jgi:hypothetical protein
MARWTDWHNIDRKSKILGINGPFNDHGIYQIRLVKNNKKPLKISRLTGEDPLGIIYIGRSGFRKQKTKRSIRKRLREFLDEQHSGGIAYSLIKTKISRKLLPHNLEARALFLRDNQIKSKECREINQYLRKYAELPPCNSSFPNRKKRCN